ncbi:MULTISPECIES: sugar transferase [Pseudomonas]|jgi:lipopolysaccharide/colanic/teichoic acid biosynthesis glycosyltransferase|uniref:Sugar transferase n=2 Tax=Pseudomonas TaxID=286 RepID=A0A423J4U4_9PSED|nr:MULTISPECIES: sugar transferase [Pseudomonas]EJN20873.1 glycosyl transferase possibly involved in lipopolysaccharide synthesis [Pseudomonas sp. GM79]KZN21136.1 sugar transferase [Pseudomonas fluorescens]MBD9562593.1 sugar transferase [Pseudomonas sp. PDM09]MBV7498075.1 sugar transferase [Pseudomonas sp. PDM24]RON32647.1 sugar transferase [Pseudomonas frederiksbergensis]
MTGHEKGVLLNHMLRDKRLDPEHRMRLDTAIHMQGRGWMTGRDGGRPWTLSRTNRVVACLGALVILLLLSPVLLGLALVIKFSSPGPVMFVQKRTGYRGRLFGMYKFRTMVTNAEELKESLRHLNKHGADAIDFKIDNDPRITPIGSFLRRSSLDELPNLINVVSGDMRLVGPRPTSFNAYRYKDSHLARLSIYPGMTGLWQISGRSNIDFDQRVELDLSYIAEQSLLLDLKILLKTPFKVFSGHGAS